MTQFSRCLKILIFTILLTSHYNPVFSQDEDAKSIGFSIRSLGVSVGWYKPGMSYWNSEYFPEHQWENEFKGSLLYSGFLECNIIENFRLKASGSYYTETVNSGVIPVGQVTGTEQLKTSLTFLSLDAIYRIGFLAFEKFSPYVGLGGNLVLVQNKFTREPVDYDPESYTNKGQDVTGTVIAGIDRKFGKHFALAIDFRYLIGSYKQEMKDLMGDVTTHPVSLNGPAIGLNILYIFN